MNLLRTGLLVALFIGTLTLPAQSESRVQFKNAEKAYKSGKTTQAVQLLESLLKQNPKDRKSQNLIIEALVVLTIESYLTGQEEKSSRFLFRAMEIAPNVKQVQSAYKTVRNRYENLPSSQNSIHAPVSDSSAIIPSFDNVLKSLASQQEQILHTTRDALNVLVKTSADEKKQILKSLAQRETLLVDELAKERQLPVILILMGMGIIVLLMGSIVFMNYKMAASREKILIEQGLQLSQSLQQQSEENFNTLSKMMNTLPHLIQQNKPTLTDNSQDNVAEKLHKIDIIDAEIVQGQMEQEDKESNKLLQMLLEDPNPEVRARAIQVLIKYDLEEAFRRIEDMLSSSLVSVRIMAVKILHGVATDRSVEILIGCLLEEEEPLQREALSALRSLLNENLSDKTKETVQTALKTTAEKARWIIE